ncbi:hypothetical protein AGMMS49936_10990 [Endomicrobiia bacterium]|nr:hypothetical protein AGMMS49936_10990 [Endomicrobiia bacterium]
MPLIYNFKVFQFPSVMNVHVGLGKDDGISGPPDDDELDEDATAPAAPCSTI